MTYLFNYISNELKRIIEPATGHSHKFQSALGYKLYDNAYVAPYYGWSKSIGCIIDESGREIKDSECIEWKENAAFYDIDDCESEHKKVIFLGFLLTGFGHSYTDDLRKLWFLKTDECSSLIRDGYELVYTTSWNRPLPSAVLEIFSLAGLDFSTAKHVTHLTHYDRIVIPDNCLRASDFGRVYCQEYEDLINCIKSSIPDSGIRIPKVYFSRTKFTAGLRKEYGEEDIVSVFRRLGYEIIIPEDHSVIEQIQMVRNCDCFAATEGSVSHLSLFCKADTRVTIICKANYLNFHQVMVNEFADLNTTYIEAHHSSRANAQCPWWGPFYLCITHHLEHFVGHPIMHLPYWAKFSYWEYTRNILYKCFNRSRKVYNRLRRQVFRRG